MLCYVVNFFVMIVFIIINGEASSGGPYLLWTWIFLSSGIKTLIKKGTLAGTYSSECIKDVTINIDKNTQFIVNNDKILCPYCNKEFPKEDKFCQFCGNKIEKNSNFMPKVSDVEKSIDIHHENNIDSYNDKSIITKFFMASIDEKQEAIDANKTSQPYNELDVDFGLVPHKPIYVVGIDEQKKYLKSLCTVNGEPIKWNRRGSMNVVEVNGIVDVYDTFLPSGEEYKTIYINMYGAYNSSLVPKGFAYSNQHNATVSYAFQKIKSKKISKNRTVFLTLGIVSVVAIICIFFAIPEIRYQRAYKLLNENKFDAACLAFEKLGNYHDSTKMIDECLYQKACSLLDSCSYNSAISLFEDLDGYKKSEDKINEAKYGYVSKHKNNNDRTTFSYLKELKKQDYKDSANIYKNLYEWKITVVAISSSEDNDTVHKSSISKYDAVYIHFNISGGEPDESVRITVKSILPNGEEVEYVFEDKYADGDSLWYGWPDGLYNNPKYGTTGTFRCYFYDDDENLIGASSVKIIN